MISANGGLPAHRYTPQVTPRWPRGSEPASVKGGLELNQQSVIVHRLEPNNVFHQGSLDKLMVLKEVPNDIFI